MLIPVRLIVSYNKEGYALVKVLGITVYSTKRKNKKPKKSVKKEAEREKKANLAFLKENTDTLISLLKTAYRSAKRELVVEKFRFSLKFGLGDAALTGIFSGGVYAVVNSFCAFVYTKFKVKEQKVDILPDFDNNIMELDVYIRIRLRVFNLIRMLFSLLISFLK